MIIQEQIVETSNVVCSTGASAAQIFEVVKVIPQDRISERNAEQIVELVHSIPMEVESAQMERTRGTSR